MTRATPEQLANATAAIHKAVSNIEVLDAIALLAIATSFYTGYVRDRAKENLEGKYVAPTPDAGVDVA